jgi:hypothetical protein
MGSAKARLGEEALTALQFLSEHWLSLGGFVVICSWAVSIVVRSWRDGP